MVAWLVPGGETARQAPTDEPAVQPNGRDLADLTHQIGEELRGLDLRESHVWSFGFFHRAAGAVVDAVVSLEGALWRARRLAARAMAKA